MCVCWRDSHVSFIRVFSGTAPSVLLGKPLVKGSAKAFLGGFSLNKGRVEGAQGGKGGKGGKGERGQGHHSKSSFSSSSSSSSLDAQGLSGNASNPPLDGRDGRDGRDGDSKDSRDSKDGSRADGGRIKGSGSHRSREKGGGGLKGASKGGYSGRESRESHVYNGYGDGRGRDREKEAKQQSKQQSLPKSALLIPDTELSFIYCKVGHEDVHHMRVHMRVQVTPHHRQGRGHKRVHVTKTPLGCVVTKIRTVRIHLNRLLQ